MTEVDAPTYHIASADLSADISGLGAQLVRLQDETGRDLLWDGDPAFWTGRAPILFPIVGRLKNDELKVEGVTYPMRQHGFARTSAFTMAAHEPASCRLRITSGAATRVAYPFDFSLDLVYRIDGPSLTIAGEVRNTGSAPMPIAFGFHPALRWPLPYGQPRSEHEILFDQDEPAPLHPLSGGLLSSSSIPSPVQGQHLPLADDLFRNDALIFLAPHSRSVRYGASHGKSLRVDFPDMPQLGIWSKPGAGFVCIEPWHGYASPENFDGELADKPGMMSLPAGATKVFSMQIAIGPD